MFYNLPNTKSKRATSLGRGVKHDFLKDRGSGSDNFYNIRSEFNEKRPNGPSYSFGISRDCYEKVFLNSNKIMGKESPGPGKYSLKSTICNDKSPKYTMGQKINISQNKSMDSPFGSTIKLPTDINPLGKFPVSNIKNATNIVFGCSKEKRFNYKCNIYYLLNLYSIYR